MNGLNDDEIEFLATMAKEHRPVTFKVLIHLRQKGTRKGGQTAITWVRASSRARAEYIGLHTYRNLYGSIYRKRGLIVSRATARADRPPESAAVAHELGRMAL